MTGVIVIMKVDIAAFHEFFKIKVQDIVKLIG